MKISLRNFITGNFLLFFTLFAACSGNSDSSNQNSNNSAGNLQNANLNNVNNIKDNLEELKQLIKMPFEPEEIVWREENSAISGENNSAGKQKLTAVLRFSPEEANKITEQAAAVKAGSPTVIESENWFPSELIAQSQVSGDETIKGTIYSPNDFIQPPYVNGKLTRVENSDYFILDLTTY